MRLLDDALAMPLGAENGDEDGEEEEEDEQSDFNQQSMQADSQVVLHNFSLSRPAQ